MAHFMCKCGEDLWNGLVPNDIQIRVFKNENWLQAVNNDVNMDEDYDIWKCPKCNRVYSFRENKVDKMFIIEDVEIKIFTSCLCGEQNDFKHYIAYTDIEMDKYTLDADTASQMPQPPRGLWSCNKCNRFFLKESQSKSIEVYNESDFYSTDETIIEDKRPRCIYLIPNGFAGWVEIYYGQDSYSYVEINNNEYQFEIPITGVLKISNNDIEDDCAEEEYYYIDSNGNRIRRLDLGDSHRFQESNGTLKERFFVGELDK